MPDPMADALAALITAGGGVRRIAREYGVEAEPLRRRWEAAKGNRPPVDETRATQRKADRKAERVARAPAPAREDSDADAVALSAVDRLELELRECRATMAKAQAAGQHSTWLGLCRHEHVLGLALDKARLDDRTERAAREAAELRDPEALARVALEQIPWLAQLVPVEARRCLEALAIALGDVDEPNEEG